MSWQTVIVAVLIGIAAIYMVRRGIRYFSKKNNCGCDHCPVVKRKV